MFMKTFLRAAVSQRFVAVFSLLLVMLVSGRSWGQSFTSGNVAVFVAASNSAANTTGSIVEFNTTIASQTGTTHAIPGTGTSALRFSGSATSTCYLANSNDGSLLSFIGANSTDASSNVNTLNPRGVGTLNSGGTYSVATTYTGSSGNQTR